jgi:hypothetical protein
VHTYEATIDLLEQELTRVEDTFRGLSPEEWQTVTQLMPVDPALPRWTLLELAGHFDISIGLTRALIAGRGPDQAARDRTSFFINPRSETGPAVYFYAYAQVAGRPPAEMADRLHETFSKTVAEARAVPADTVGPGYFAPMRVDEFVASRVVEAVVHGLDLTLPLSRPTIATPEGVAFTAAILDDLLARRTVGTRPPGLADDLDWVMAASGRATFDDNRLPLIG